MNFERKRKISVGLSSIYFLSTAAVLGYVVIYHSWVSCSGLALLPFCGLMVLFAELAKHSQKDYDNMPSFIDPAEFGMSIGTAKFIRSLALLLPLPLIAYGIYFATGMSWFALDGSPASIARTYRVVALDEKIFGHRMAQREFRRVARVYAFKRNFAMAEHFIQSAIACAEEHSPDKPSTSMWLHYEAGKIAVRAEHWDLAESQFSTALQIAHSRMGLTDDNKLVKRLTRRINAIREQHLTPTTDWSQPIRANNCVLIQTPDWKQYIRLKMYP